MEKYVCPKCGAYVYDDIALAVHDRNMHDTSRHLEVFEKILEQLEYNSDNQTKKDQYSFVKNNMLKTMLEKHPKKVIRSELDKDLKKILKEQKIKNVKLKNK